VGLAGRPSGRASGVLKRSSHFAATVLLEHARREHMGRQLVDYYSPKPTTSELKLDVYSIPTCPVAAVKKRELPIQITFARL
jgi:hypothetical protein